MLFGLGAAAASGAVNLLSSLGKSAASRTSSPQSNPSFDIAGAREANPTSGAGGSKGLLSPGTFNALLAQDAGQQTPAVTGRRGAVEDLLKLFDLDGDEKISKSEFQDKLGAGGTDVQAADQVFAKLDKNSDEFVSLDELSSALQNRGQRHRHHALSSYDFVENLIKPQSNAQASAVAQSQALAATQSVSVSI